MITQPCPAPAPQQQAPFTEQDRIDLQTLNSAIREDLRAEQRCTTASVELGAHLLVVKGRGLWRLERQGSFYDWVYERHGIRETMSTTYLLIVR